MALWSWSLLGAWGQGLCLSPYTLSTHHCLASQPAQCSIRAAPQIEPALLRSLKEKAKKFDLIKREPVSKGSKSED